MKVFVDTNVLLYRFDAGAPKKQAIARADLRRLILDRSILVSTQVLQEFFVAATRKLTPPLRADRAEAVVGLLSRLPCVQVTPRMVMDAIGLHRRHSLSFWDALIVRSALEGGADTLYSEDLQAGQQIEGLSIVNPFAAARGR